MAGRGPAPKHPDRRGGHQRSAALRVIVAPPMPQPDLPDALEWPAATRDWWAMWGTSPLSADFTATDWSYLLDTALLHARVWSGQPSHAAELRLRVAKFGATPEDRARLRITFAQADAADAGRGTRAASTRDRLPGLKLADPPKENTRV